MAVSDDGKPVMNAELMRRALLYAQHFGVPVIQHAEDLNLTGSGVMHEGEWSTKLGLPGIPGAAEDVMVARDLDPRRGHRRPLPRRPPLDGAQPRHGAAREGPGARRHLRGGAPSPDPHRRGGGDERLLDPDQDEAAAALGDDREALLNGLADGTVDCIASDHAPHHADEKDVEFNMAPFGIVGLETTLSLCLDRLVRPGILSLPRLVELLSTGPARVLGVAGGTLEVGSPADVTVFHPDDEVTLRAASFRSRGRNTPFDGWTLRGPRSPRSSTAGGRSRASAPSPHLWARAPLSASRRL